MRFEDVSFGYDALAPVLRDINIDAKPGQVIALMGPTGSGKTTVVHLMPRFYDVTGGAHHHRRARHPRPDARLAAQRHRHRAAGRVPVQRHDPRQHRLRRRGRDRRARSWPRRRRRTSTTSSRRCPTATTRWVGERGITLSGGQKQRVAIARTLLLDPKILILDDSTSSVDTQTEYQIQQSMTSVMEGRTTFVIAQRLRTVKMADQIIVLQDGRIVERGKHDELLAKDGIYRQIYDLELRDQEEALAGQDSALATAAGS